MSFKSYVMSKRIYEFDKPMKIKSKEYTDGLICEHINLICDLHGRLKGCSIPITNMTNKMLEDFRVAEIFLRQDIERYKFNSKNQLEENISQVGEEILYRIRKILGIIESLNYEKMVLRSMRTKEICAYNVNINDIYIDSEMKIYVRNIDQFCENILEYDYIKFLSRLKRGNKEVDFIKVCSYICSKEVFNLDSYNFIIACLSFPYEFVRLISKYRDLGRNLSDYSDKCDFDEILKRDGVSLV